MPRNYKGTRRREIEARLADGVRRADIAERMGVSSSYVTEVAQRGGFGPAPPPNRPFTAEEDATIREMHAAGERYMLIAKALNRTKNMICSRVRRLGLANPVTDDHQKRERRRDGAPSPIELPQRITPTLRIAARNEALPPNDREALAIWNYFHAIDRKVANRGR